MFPADLLSRAEVLLAACRRGGLTLATAESCTGGLVAALLTELAGSSASFDRGFVTYSNAAKQTVLGVPAAMLDRHGAVSEACARAMAEGTLRASTATVAVSITGIAGPGGGTADKPVGLVHFGCASRAGPTGHAVRHFGPLARGEIRLASVAQALDLFDAEVSRAAG